MFGTDFTYEALAGLRDALPHLDRALVPGTPRRWAERCLTLEQRTRADRLAVEEREAKAYNLAQGIKALGDGRAPLRLDVLDAIRDITVGVEELEAAVCDGLELTPLGGASTFDRITRVIGLLRRIDLYEVLARHVQAEAGRLHRQARSALGDAEMVRKLEARCHICDGKSLRAFPERELIVCVNDECRCDNEDCRCHLDYPQRHRWPFSQWPWLASVLAEGIGGAP